MTSFAPIRLAVPHGVGFDVTARTSFGRITTDLPVTATGTIGQDALSGTIAGGGCPVVLTNTNGDIQILREPVRKTP